MRESPGHSSSPHNAGKIPEKIGGEEPGCGGEEAGESGEQVSGLFGGLPELSLE